MNEPFYTIHHQLIEVQRQLYQLQHVHRLRQQAILQIEQNQQTLIDLKAQQERLQRQLDIHTPLNRDLAGWQQRDQQLRGQLRNTALYRHELETQLVYLRQQITQLTARQKPTADENYLRLEQTRLQQAQLKLLRRSTSAEVKPLQELELTENAIEKHLIEIDEALQLIFKIENDLDALIIHAKTARSAIFLYNANGRQPQILQQKIERVRPKIAWLQRELWDINLQFETEPQLPRIGYWAEWIEEPLIDLMLLPQQIANVLSTVVAKRRMIQHELTTAHTLLQKVRAEQIELVERLWRPSVVKTQHPTERPAADQASILRIIVDEKPI